MKTTEQKNELIAEFMGWKKGHPELFELRWADDWFNGRQKMTTKGRLNFDSSWDSLMPVVGNIHRIIMDRSLFFEGINLFNAVNRCDIKEAYEEVIEMIEFLKTEKR
jgi:hypothetical protein